MSSNEFSSRKTDLCLHFIELLNTFNKFSDCRHLLYYIRKLQIRLNSQKCHNTSNQSMTKLSVYVCSE